MFERIKETIDKFTQQCKEECIDDIETYSKKLKEHESRRRGFIQKTSGPNEIIVGTNFKAYKHLILPFIEELKKTNPYIKDSEFVITEIDEYEVITISTPNLHGSSIGYLCVLISWHIGDYILKHGEIIQGNKEC